MDSDLKVHLDQYDEIMGLLCDLVIGLVDTNYINTVLVSGTAGIGKSYNVERLLLERQEREINPINYVKYTGHVTPRALYEKLKESASSNCVLLFDDADSVITNDDSVNIIKAASERKAKRHINWISSVTSGEGFDFEGKIIVITNIVVSQSPHLTAIKDRFHLFNMNVTYEQKIAKILDIASQTNNPQELRINAQVVEYLMTNKDRISNDKVSIRMFKKLTELAMLMPDKWQRFIEVSGTYLDDPQPIRPLKINRKN